MANLLGHVRDYLGADHRRLSRRGFVLFVAVGAALAVSAFVGIVVGVTGWADVWRHARHVAWIWLLLAFGASVISHIGYLLAYREVARHDDGPVISPGRAALMVLTGFGLPIPRGGVAVDHAELCEHGISSREARHRVTALGILEYAVLAPAAFAAALVLLLQHVNAQGGVVPSWLIGVPAGTGITLVLLRWRSRFRRRGWLRRRLARGLDAIMMTMRMLGSARHGLVAASGMAIYWAADIAALGGSLALFGAQHASVAALVLGYATGYALTRRTLPLAGAGAVEFLLPFALSWVSIPLAEAVLAVVVYRAFNLWLAVGPAVFAARYLRRTSPRIAAA